MKQIVRIIALVALVAVVGATFVACLPSKGMDAAKAAWKCALEALPNGSDYKLEGAEYKRFDKVNENIADCYAFKFILSYVDSEGNKHTSDAVYANSIPDANGGYQVQPSTENVYNSSLEKKKDYKVTKPDSLSKGQVKDLMSYYEEIKGSLWKQPAPAEDNVD